MRMRFLHGRLDLGFALLRCQRESVSSLNLDLVRRFLPRLLNEGGCLHFYFVL